MCPRSRTHYQSDSRVTPMSLPCHHHVTRMCRQEIAGEEIPGQEFLDAVWASAHAQYARACADTHPQLHYKYSGPALPRSKLSVQELNGVRATDAWKESLKQTSTPPVSAAGVTLNQHGYYVDKDVLVTPEQRALCKRTFDTFPYTLLTNPLQAEVTGSLYVAIPLVLPLLTCVHTCSWFPLGEEGGWSCCLRVSGTHAKGFTQPTPGSSDGRRACRPSAWSTIVSTGVGPCEGGE